jgi:hypothetical protein
MCIISKSRQKLDSKKVVKMWDHTYVYNSLTINMKHMMTGNGNHVTAENLLGKIREMTFGKIYFWRDFSHLEPLCAGSSCLAGWQDGWLDGTKEDQETTNKSP